VAFDKLTELFLKYVEVLLLNSFQSGTVWLDLDYIVDYRGPVLITKYYSGNQIEKNELGGASSA
jgi:hypothetical protein